jgi:EAL domain-containing protein (putative c-di-GMP-specific phosphodiesterase class I)
LVDNAREDGRLGRLVRHLVEYARDEGVRVIGAGVETEAQRESAIDLGFDLLQGYLFAEPGPAFCEIARRARQTG